MIDYDKEIKRIQEEIDKYSTKALGTVRNGVVIPSNVYIVLIILTIFLIAGLHRITNGKILSGLLFAITVGGCFIWLFIDIAEIVSGKFTDKYGKPIDVRAVTKLQVRLEELKACRARI